MEEWKVSAIEVESIIMKPDGRIRQSKDKWIFYKRFPSRADNLIAAVMVEQELGRVEILTILSHFEVRK